MPIISRRSPVMGGGTVVRSSPRMVGRPTRVIAPRARIIRPITPTRTYYVDDGSSGGVKFSTYLTSGIVILIVSIILLLIAVTVFHGILAIAGLISVPLSLFFITNAVVGMKGISNKDKNTSKEEKMKSLESGKEQSLISCEISVGVLICCILGATMAGFFGGTFFFIASIAGITFGSVSIVVSLFSHNKFKSAIKELEEEMNKEQEKEKEEEKTEKKEKKNEKEEKEEEKPMTKIENTKKEKIQEEEIAR